MQFDTQPDKDRSTGDGKTRHRIIPVRIFAIIVAGIFFAEVIAMLMINLLPLLPDGWQILLDATIVIVLTFPLILLLSYKPLLTNIADLKRSDAGLREMHTSLKQRTGELVHANEELLAEIAERTSSEGQVRLQSAALEAAANGMIITDRDGNIRWANRAFSNMTGYSLEDVLGQNLRLLKSGQHDNEYYREMWERILSGQVWRGETINRRKDGSLYIEEQTITPVVDEKGEITHFIAIKQDITERKQAEIALLESEEKFRTLVTWTYDWEKWVDPQGNMVYTSPSCERITGYLPEEFHSDPSLLLRIVHPDDRKSYEEHTRLVHAETANLSSLEYRIIARDGTEHWIEHLCRPLFGKEDRYLGRRVSSRDVTERKKAGETLRYERSKLRNILDTMQDGVYIVSQEFDIEYINPALEKDFGAVGERKCYQFFHDRTEVCEWCPNLKVFAGESLSWEWHSVKTGKTYDLFDTPFVNPDGKISKLEIFHDITERKRVEDQLARQQKDLLELTNSERKQRQTAEALCAAAQSLTRSLRLEQVVDLLLDHINKVIPYDTASVALLEEEARLALRAVRGNGHWQKYNAILAEQAVTKSIVQRLISSRKSLLIPKLADYTEREIVPEVQEVNSWLVSPILTEEKAIGVVWIGKNEPGFFDQEHAELTEALVSQAGVAIQNAWLFEQVRTNSERLKLMSHRLAEVQENELRYIAQELHDEVGQAITSLTLGLQRIQKEADKPEVVREELARIDQVVDEIMENLHRLSMDLRPASLDRLGLEEALRQHIEILCEKLKLKIEFKMIGVGERLPANLEIALYRIVQEALNNIARHARASRADVLLQRRNDNLILIVEDNGEGFDPVAATKSGRLGLIGMRERAEMLGGKLVIESSSGSGTTIFVEIPYAYSNTHR